ncbi:bromodomain-containing protein 7 isoform X1 [Centruroides vittatus]|uniref:bromodomain-containing protein 7 isoform X1 n=2 Tax=Centruroides vittatus TaxID=120091 RepID=UPI00350EC95F
MGSKKHKKHHRSEKKEAIYEDRSEKPLKLVLKVGGNSSSVQAPIQSHPSAPPPLVPSTQFQHLESFTSQSEIPHLTEEKPRDMCAYSPEKHKKSKKKKKKKSSEKEKIKHDKKRKHHHHHHHREHSHERKFMTFHHDKKKRDHDTSQDSADTQDHDQEPPTKYQHLDELAPCERPLRDPRTCTLKKKAMKNPLQMLLFYLLKNLQKKDPQQFFAWPVSDIIAPGYSSIISDPMDFSTMRKKIENKEYSNVNEFRSDLKLMCDNAMTYNRPDTVYFKSAKKMWHVGEKLLSQDQLLLLRRNLPYISDLGAEELGFDPDDDADEDYVKEEIISDSCSVVLQDIKKSKIKGSWTQNQNDTDSQDDDLSPEEILAEARKAAKAAADRLTLSRPKSRYGFLRQHENGSTTLALLNPSSGKGIDKENNGQTEMKVNLEMLTGKLTQGTGSITRFREDAKNIVKPVNYLNYGSFTSYSPQYDSMFANLTKEESDLVLSAYGDDTGVQYAESIMSFAKDCDFVMNMVDNLLDILTGGEHSKTMKLLEEKRKGAEEEKKKLDDLSALVTETLSTEKKGIGTVTEPTNDSDIRVDFDSLNALSSVDLDMSLLDNVGESAPKNDESVKKLQNEVSLSEQRRVIQRKLDSTTKLLQNLAKVQHERLSAEPPPHLANIQGPSAAEQELAERVSQKLADIASQATPSEIVSVECLRKAMGITFRPVSDEPVTVSIDPPEDSQEQKSTIEEVVNQVEEEERVELTVDNRVSQELVTCSPNHLATDDRRLRTTTDIESEFREFLETAPNLRVCESPSGT